MSEDIKKFTEFDKGIKLVRKPNDLDDADDDPNVLRAELSCGHVTDPGTLTDCCSAQLKDGKTKFKCPLCKEEWPYDEVKKLAKLTLSERFSFEDMLGKKAVKKLVDFRDCPRCHTCIERTDVSNLCVQCSVCTESDGEIFEFCWQCMREWKGPQPCADQCENVDCKKTDQELLRDCPMILLKAVHVQCPKIRACPFCRELVEHNNEGCQFMTCPECTKEFCFVCLKPDFGNDLDLDLDPDPNLDYHSDYSCTVAPRQILD